MTDTFEPSADRAKIEISSFMAHRLWPKSYSATLGHATGFVIVEDASGLYLITNRHVVTGKNADNECADDGIVPQSLDMVLHQDSVFRIAGYETRRVNIPLYDDHFEPIWWEHPRFGRLVDVVVIPLQGIPDLVRPGTVLIMFSSEGIGSERKVRVTEEVFVLGFPLDVSDRHEGMAIWSRASVASEPAIDYDGLPCFLIDSRTRKGQSGAPVMRHHPSDTDEAQGGLYLAVDELLGVYSGRVNNESDLGFVWRAEVVREIIDGRTRATSQSIRRS